jgi:hypothetical protein
MTEQKDGTCFEFGEEQNRALLQLSLSLHRLGVVVLVAGLLLVGYLVVSYADPVPLLNISDTRSVALGIVDYALWVLIALLIIYVSIKVMKLARPIRLIVETRGADVPNLMEFVTDLTRLCRASRSVLLLTCALIVLSLVLLILVF